MVTNFKKLTILGLFAFAFFSFYACGDDDPSEQIEGCSTDSTASNYVENPDIEVDCIYNNSIEGCSTDPAAANYVENPDVEVDCIYEGCSSDTTAFNYLENPDIEVDCIYAGCSSDPSADNYLENPDIEVDCTYDLSRFYGDYSGSSDCEGGLIIPLFTNDSLLFSVKESIDGGNTLFFELNIQGTPVGFDATSDGDNIIIDSGVTFPFPLDSDFIEITLDAVATLAYDASNQSITGTINFDARLATTGTTLDQGSCDITGIKN